MAHSSSKASRECGDDWRAAETTKLQRVLANRLAIPALGSRESSSTFDRWIGSFIYCSAVSVPQEVALSRRVPNSRWSFASIGCAAVSRSPTQASAVRITTAQLSAVVYKLDGPRSHEQPTTGIHSTPHAELDEPRDLRLTRSSSSLAGQFVT